VATFHGPRRKYSLSIVGKAFIQGRCMATEVIRFLLVCSLTRRMCLPSRCLAMNVNFHFTIPAFGHRITICWRTSIKIRVKWSLSHHRLARHEVFWWRKWPPNLER
jgi:hypothetical protein